MSVFDICVELNNPFEHVLVLKTQVTCSFSKSTSSSTSAPLLLCYHQLAGYSSSGGSLLALHFVIECHKMSHSKENKDHVKINN